MKNYTIKMNITYYLESSLSDRILEHSLSQNSLFSSYEGTHVRMQQSFIGFALKSNQY